MRRNLNRELKHIHNFYDLNNNNNVYIILSKNFFNTRNKLEKCIIKNFLEINLIHMNNY